MQTMPFPTYYLAIAAVSIAMVGSARQALSEEHAGPEVVDIGLRRELFVDHHLIAELKGTRLQLCKPRPAETAIRIDRPWEGAFNAARTVMKVDGRYRMYYRAWRAGGKALLCVAESADGIRWTKPSLGLVEVHGTRDNNVVATESGSPIMISPFIDQKPGVPDTERFKGVTCGWDDKRVHVWTSPDGLRWRPFHPTHVFVSKLPNAFDTYNLAFWSATENCYVLLFRAWSEGVRSIGRTTSQDLIRWMPESFVTYDDGVATPPEDLYTISAEPYFRAPQIYVAFPARFMKGRRVVTDAQLKQMQMATLPGEKAGVVHQYHGDCSDGVFMTSRGGPHFDRTFMEVFVRPGTGPENWTSRTNYPLQGVVQTGPSEMSLYVKRHYAQPSWHVQRLVLRLDGFASVRAPYQGGELLTKLLAFSGKQLEINMATSAAGEVRVEIQGCDGKPVPGFELANCHEIVGDEISRIVKWESGSDVRALAGKPIRLRFVMKDADLFSFRFH